MLQRFKNYYHLAVSTLASTMYQFPARNLFIIGVTGTDGKTTTTSLIYHILKEAGKKVAMVSTVGAQIGGTMYDTGFHTTTPSSLALQKYIYNAKKSHNEYLVLEVTSHSIDQHRAAFIPFQIGVLTNISHEHLDYHKTYDNYVKTKAKLLNKAKTIVINHDDQSYKMISEMKFFKEKKVITYGMSDAEYTPASFPVRTHLIGEFNTLNCLAAVAVARQIGIDDGVIQKALLSFTPPPGRQELVYAKEFMVMIDFAHTPQAFERLLPAIKEKTKGRIIHVFGSAGERDVSKRPLMGQASAEYSNIIVLTAEDPRSEKAEEIIDQLASKISKKEFVITDDVTTPIQKKAKYVFKIPNRKSAIEFAIQLAQKDDYVVITGKSHEKSMNMGNGEEPWDEFEVTNQALKKK